MKRYRSGPTSDKMRGFTLLELLVVMAIIGVLASVIFLAVESARLKAREASRIAGIREIQKALEMYYTANGQYPLQTSPDNLSNLSTSLVPTYIKAIVYDMTDISGPIYYRPASTPSSYLIYVSKETLTAPGWYGCRTGVGPTVDTLYVGSPRC